VLYRIADDAQIAGIEVEDGLGMELEAGDGKRLVLDGLDYAVISACF
jgi:hypothetical protein